MIQIATPEGIEMDSRSGRERNRTSPTRIGRSLEAIPGRDQYTEEARLQRLDFLRRETGVEPVHVANTTLDPETLRNNVENFIGVIQVPIGLAGPLLFHGQNVKGPVYLPMATTEGALVASATRGARALTEGAGVETCVIRQRMIRVPLFEFGGLGAAAAFAAWVIENEDAIRVRATEVSNHARLVSLDPKVLGRAVHLEFAYETGDAAGQNMTTACTWQACRWILSQLESQQLPAPDHFVVEANMSGDKKVNHNALLNGRGTHVVATSFVDGATLESVLKVTPAQLARTFRSFCVGSAAGGHIGRNVNVSNTVAAAFTACGQDIACVHESSLAVLDMEETDGGIALSLTLPGLIVGSVGGGTHLPQQREVLEILGCTGPGGSARLAEIIAGYAMALDLSTLSAIAAGQFASSHERLGRNRPVQPLDRDDLDAAFFEPGLRQSSGDPSLKVTEVEALRDDSAGSSILTELTAGTTSRLVGLLPFRVSAEGRETGAVSREVFAKVKASDDEVIHMLSRMASQCGPELGRLYGHFRNKTGFAGCHLRELALYRLRDPRFTRNAPEVYDVVEDPAREAYVIVMERLRDMALIDSVDDPSAWQGEQVRAALSGIAEFHSIWWNRAGEARQEPWIGEVPTAAAMIEMRPLWRALCRHAGAEFHWYRSEHLEATRGLIDDLPNWWSELEEFPATLIHNDFNPRNVALRKGWDGDLRACIYDWELATVQVPQHDLAEFLAFAMTPDVPAAVVDAYVEHHRERLQAATCSPIDAVSWQRGYELSLCDLLVARLPQYLMAHTFKDYAFLPRVMATLQHLLKLARSRRSSLRIAA